jgi:hypothetical protein
MYKTAGVTFESRQQILEDIYNKSGPFIRAWLEKTTYDSEPAIKVLEQSSGLQIGWIAKVDVPELYDKPCQEIFGEIGNFEGRWYCKLKSPILWRNPTARFQDSK